MQSRRVDGRSGVREYSIREKIQASRCCSTSQSRSGDLRSLCKLLVKLFTRGGEKKGDLTSYFRKSAKYILKYHKEDE